MRINQRLWKADALSVMKNETGFSVKAIRVIIQTKVGKYWRRRSRRQRRRKREKKIPDLFIRIVSAKTKFGFRQSYLSQHSLVSSEREKRHATFRNRPFPRTKLLFSFFLRICIRFFFFSFSGEQKNN